MIRIYGYSDDLVEVERDGQFYKEVDAYDVDIRFEFSDNTHIRVGYCKPELGIWYIIVEKQGSAEQTLDVCLVQDEDCYSDEFRIEAEIVAMEAVPQKKWTKEERWNLLAEAGEATLPDAKPVRSEADKHFEPGETVYIVERDEDGNANDTAGVIFLFSLENVVFCSPGINGHIDLEYLLSEFVRETAESCGRSSVCVYPKKDCYHTLAEAEAALEMG